MTKRTPRRMPTTTSSPRPGPAPFVGVTAAQQRRAVVAIRRIAALPPVKYACERCEVGWAGPERDCWSCGLPASARSRQAASALHLLLGAVTGPDTKAA